MRYRLALTVVSTLGLAGTSATTHAQPLIDRHGKAQKIATGGEGGRGLQEVDAAHRRHVVSRTAHVVVNLAREEVVGGTAETPPADSDFPAAGTEG
jgi:hypothetical protein